MTSLHIRSTTVALAMGALATPGFAQADLCGGSGSGGRWIGGDEASSDIAVADTYLEQMALVLGGNEYVALFTVSEPTEVRVEAEGRGAGDTIIDLIGGSGGVILSDDDSGGNGASRAEAFLEPGAYCMNLRSYDGGPMTAFVRVGRTEHAPLTDGVTDTPTRREGSCSDAVSMGTVGDSFTTAASDAAFVSFTIETPTPVSITAENEDADPSISLFDSADELIDENDDYDGLNSQIDVTEPLAAGTYCIGLVALADNDAPITINITEYDPAAAQANLYARGEASPPLDGTYPVTSLGALQGRMRQDVQASDEVTWFSVEIEEAGLILVEAIGAAGGDPWVIVYDDLGREQAQNDDYGGNLDSLVAVKVEAGTYVIGTRLYDGSNGLVRLLAERFVPAQ